MQATLAMDVDPATGLPDLVIRGRTLALDVTPRTPAIVSLYADRRARPDDALPVDPAPLLQPDLLDPRRGWWGDALDPQGRRTGSRLWLLSRAKETEATRRRAELYAREALAWASPMGLAVAAAWIRRGVLQLSCAIGREQVVIERDIT